MGEFFSKENDFFLQFVNYRKRQYINNHDVDRHMYIKPIYTPHVVYINTHKIKPKAIYDKPINFYHNV